MSRLLPALTLLALGADAIAAPPAQFLREQRQVSVAGQQEVWKLVWIGQPKSFCGPEDPEMAITCPCSGWAYGEYGRLQLQRQRGGTVIDRLELGPLFDELPANASAGLAGMQWRPFKASDTDADRPDAAAWLDDILRRPGPRVMQMADYDHDGVASEFLIQTSTGPCGHTDYVAVGVSKANPRLHAFGTIAHPDGALQMPGQAWQALLTGTKPQRVTVWPCGDHGSDTHDELDVSARAGAIAVTAFRYECRDDGAKGKLVEQQSL